MIDTITAPLAGGRVEAVWMAKAQTANWRTDEIRFRVTAAGIACESSNALKFRQRPTTSWELKNVTHPSGGGFAPSHEKHDVRLERNRVHFSLKLRTHGDPFDATKQTAAKNLIEGVWNNGFSGKKFHRAACGRGNTCDCSFDCCKVDFRLDVNFVTSGEHLAVQVFATAPGDPAHRSSMNGDGGQWGDPAMTPATTYAHETGHVLGQHDEYSSGATDPTSPPAQPANATTPNLMSTPGNTTLLNRHYRYALAYLNSKADGDAYETIPPGE
ncbi:hypothetical protein H0E84_19580 [Luteimonas sp. SJ-92]|uniref:Uncharacterized protein n=1 Tax=Luteimonas salinisoli TaxID=2752307 RepID=A0A853JJ28_9GAMM|nr:hypothetical protein [Luteimonas salinisoli]NZA28579.1 hypothetical protein [Luteimonas salinisoli]